MDRWPKRGGAKRPESSSGTSSPLTSGSENLFATFRQPNYNPQTRAILTAMRPVEARYEDGVLKPEKPLPLRAGDRVSVIVLRRPDPARWDLQRLAAGAEEDEALAGAGVDGWADTFDGEDRR